MKKSLLLTVLMAIMLVCIFAISVGAAGSTSNEFAETPDTIDGVTVPTTIGTTERVVLLGADGNYYTYPAYYIVKDQTSFSIVQNKALNVALGYSESTASLKDYVVRIEIPNGITYIDTTLNYKSKLVYVKMSDTVTSVAAKVFQECKNLETLILSNKLTNISNDFCKDNSKLTSITIPASVKEMKGYAFNGCSSLKTVINYAENVTSIDGNFLSGCPIENEFNFPDALTSIGAYAFNGAKFTNIDIPNSVTTMGNGVFQNCTNLTFVRFPENLTELPHDSIKGTTNSNITIVIPKGCASINSLYSLQNTGIKKIIFTGNESSAFVASVAAKASGYVSKIEYANHCEYYYNNIHNTELKYVFTSFVEECYTEGVCSRCNETKKDETFDPIFKFLGYSSNGENMCAGYMISIPSIDKYNEVNASAPLKYGFVASANNNTPINENGVFAENTIGVDLSNEKYVAFDFILKGDFTNPSSAVAKISMNLYTITKNADGANVISYIYGYNEGNVIVSDVYEIADSVSFNDLNSTEA